jgi:hypothetical protein
MTSSDTDDSDDPPEFDPAPMIPGKATGSGNSMPVEAIAQSIRDGKLTLADVRDDDRISVEDLPMDTL